MTPHTRNLIRRAIRGAAIGTAVAIVLTAIMAQTGCTSTPHAPVAAPTITPPSSPLPAENAQLRAHWTEGGTAVEGRAGLPVTASASAAGQSQVGAAGCTITALGSPSPRLRARVRLVRNGNECEAEYVSGSVFDSHEGL